METSDPKMSRSRRALTLIRELRGWRRQVARATLVLAVILCGMFAVAMPAAIVVLLYGDATPGVVFQIFVRLAIVASVVASVRTGWYLVRLTTATADELRVLDTRAPVLYLRPFAEDNILQTDGWDPLTAERILANILDEVGPPIAIGRPKDLAPLGGIASMDPSDRWRTTIATLLNDACLIVIQAGHSPGLLWELERARQLNNPRRILISFLTWHRLSRDDRNNRYAEFRVIAREALQVDPPESLGKDIFWGFDQGWLIHRVEPRTWVWAFIGQSAFNQAGIREVLRPVLASRGFQIRWHRTFVAAAVYTVLCLWVLLFLSGVIWLVVAS